MSPRLERLSELAAEIGAVLDECETLVADLSADKPIPAWVYAMRAAVFARRAQREIERLAAFVARRGS